MHVGAEQEEQGGAKKIGTINTYQILREMEQGKTTVEEQTNKSKVYRTDQIDSLVATRKLKSLVHVKMLEQGRIVKELASKSFDLLIKAEMLFQGRAWRAYLD